KGARTYSVGARRSARTEDEWSWNIQAQSAQPQPPGASVQASRSFRALDLNVGADGAGSGQNVYAGASGALVAMGGGVFASRRLNDGFAVVSTSGIPAVPVGGENRLVGETDDEGRLLVPLLQSYPRNRISI